MIVELKDIERLRGGLLGGNGVEGKRMEEPSGEETKSQKPQINRQLIRNKNNKASIFFSFFFPIKAWSFCKYALTRRQQSSYLSYNIL